MDSVRKAGAVLLLTKEELEEVEREAHKGMEVEGF